MNSSRRNFILSSAAMVAGCAVGAKAAPKIPWSTEVGPDGTWTHCGTTYKLFQAATTQGAEPPPFIPERGYEVVHSEETDHPLNLLEGDGTWRLHTKWVCSKRSEEVGR